MSPLSSGGGGGVTVTSTPAATPPPPPPPPASASASEEARERGVGEENARTTDGQQRANSELKDDQSSLSV